MKILGIVIVKNEGDIMAAFLKHVANWADRVFVYDNGSTDETWEIARSVASDVIVPWKSEDIPFHNGLRARVFNEFRHEAQEGDWWCWRMDADEFYLDNPREFLSSMPWWVGRVAKKGIDYRIAREDAEEYEYDGLFENDRSKISYIDHVASVEARFIRHRESLAWDEKSGSGLKSRDPRCPIITGRRMILVQHYQHRSPQQIQRRLTTRHEYYHRKAILKGRLNLSLDSAPDALSTNAWKEHCPSRDELVLDNGRRSYDKLILEKKTMKHVHESPTSFMKKISRIIVWRLFLRPLRSKLG